MKDGAAVLSTTDMDKIMKLASMNCVPNVTFDVVEALCLTPAFPDKHSHGIIYERAVSTTVRSDGTKRRVVQRFRVFCAEKGQP